jgi:uncharacterized peroxidase-related enzyme
MYGVCAPSVRGSSLREETTLSQRGRHAVAEKPESTGSRLSWLRIPEPSSYPAKIRAMHEESRAKLGYVRTFLKLPWESDRISLYQGFLDRLMRSDDCKLSRLERELLAFVTSTENRCEPCVLAHGAAARDNGLSPEVVDEILVSWRRADLEPRHRALAEFASRLTLHPAEADESYLEPLRQAGYSEEQIFEAAQIVSIYNSNNRLNNVLGLKPNPESRASFKAG